MDRLGKSLARGNDLGLLFASTLFTPLAVSAQSIPAGEPSARTPIAIAQTAAAKPDIDKLIPLPDTSDIPPPGLADVKAPYTQVPPAMMCAA